MKRTAGLPILSLIRLHQTCFLIYVTLVLTTINSADVSKHNGGKVSYTKTGSDTIEDTKEFLRQHRNDKVDDSRNRSTNEFATISNGKNSAALNRFLEDVLKAQNDFKWIDQAARHANHRAHPENSRAYVNGRTAGSVSSARDVRAGQPGIGYGSRLRGKRGFDRNYETMWMPRKEQYEDEGARDVPQRFYLDNDVTFKRDAAGADLDALYRSHDTKLDRVLYGREATADQPLKDNTRKKDLRSLDERSNSNEKPEIDGANPSRRDYGSVREALVNSDLRRAGGKLYINADAWNPSEIASLYGQTRADEFAEPLESSAAMRNSEKSRGNAPLESLKRTVLELRNSLMLGDKKDDVIAPRAFPGDSNWWDDPRLTAAVLDLQRRDLDDRRPAEETARRTKNARNTDDENESGLNIFPGARFAGSYFEEGNLKGPHDRSRRNRRSFLADTSNHTSLAGNETIRLVSVTGDVKKLENATETQIRLPEYNASSQRIKQPAETGAETTRRNIERTAAEHANPSDYRRNLPVSNIRADSTRLSTNNDDDDDDDDAPRGSAARRSAVRELRIAARKVSRLGATDGQSKGAEDVPPRGNTSRRYFDVAAGRAEIAEGVIRANGTREESREPALPGVIRVFETRGRPYEKRVAKATAGLSAAEMRTSDVDESTGNANAKAASPSSSPIDPAGDTTAKTVAATANTFGVSGSIPPRDRHDDLVSIIVDNDSQEQQMAPSSSSAAANRDANKSNGNSDRVEIDIRALDPRNGNGTMNVKGDIRTAAIKACESDNNLQRKLLWISATTVDEARGKAITADSPIPGEIKKDEDSAAEDPTLEADLNSRASEKNRYARYKRSMYSSLGRNLEFDNEADSEDLAIEKEAAINPNEKQEGDNEEYLNQNIDGPAGDYNDEEENALEENDETIENEREGRSLLTNRKIDPMQARVDMLIKQRLESKGKSKGSDSYGRMKRNTLNMIEYYDYDGDEEERETRDALVNERQIENNDGRLSAEDAAKIKRDSQTRSYKLGGLGKKKNENAEAVMKKEREKGQLKNKEPKEGFIVDLGRPKNKTARSEDNDRQLSDFSETFENTFNERERSAAKENSGKMRENENVASNAHHEESAKTKWLDEASDNGMASPKNSETALRDNYEKRVSLDEPLRYPSNAHMDINSDIVENILLDIQPVKILERSKELGTFKDFYEDFEDERPEDRYYYQDNDRRLSNDVESAMYEELKKVYDWPDGELKSGPRLRGDQRLHYESDDKLDKKHSQLQPSDVGFFGMNENDSAERRFHSIDASCTNSNGAPSDYLALKVTDNFGPEQSSSMAENLSNILKVVEDKSGSVFEGNAAERSVFDVDSGSPYENRGYVEMRDALKRNTISGQQTAVISPQDLRESFVESLDWHDDLDDAAKIRLSRGLKAVDEMLITDPEKIHDLDNKSRTANVTNVNPKLGNSPRVSRNDTSQNWQNLHDNVTADLTDILNIRHGAIDRNAEKNRELMNVINTDNEGLEEDLEAVEQRCANRRIPRIRRAATSYRTFYDDAISNQRDPDEADGSANGRFQLSDILENSLYRGYATPSDIRDLDRYSKIPRSTGTRKKEKTGVKNKKKKKKKKKYPAKISEKHTRKGSSRSSSNGQRNRRGHTHWSDTSKHDKQDGWKSKQKKNRVEAARSAGRISNQKSEMSDRGLFRAAESNEAIDERVLYENAEDRTVKPEEEDAWRKEITLLLAADNVDDETQMDVALQGELADKIVERIFEQVRRNEQLRSVFGPGLYRNYKIEDATADNIYRPRFDEDGTNHTETMMKKVMELLGTFILDEVQRKTCVYLPPDIREFLGWMLEVDREEELLEEAPPLPLVRQEVIPEEKAGRKFLFDSVSKQEGEKDISDLQRKVRVLETLVEEYNALTAKEKTKVQTVHEYLLRQLNQLLQYIEAREMEAKITTTPTGAARTEIGSILQYQSATPNATNASYPSMKDALSSPIDTHDDLFLFNNTTFQMANKQLHHDHIASRRRETRSLDEELSKRRRERKRRKKNRGKTERKRGKHREHRDRDRAESSSGHGGSRRKRANLEVSHPDALYLGYEVPTIYDSFDVLDAKLTGKTRQAKRELTDKKNAETENDRTLDLLPIKGKNRLEDEVILLNKREAWRRENEEQLEEVAFGRDMRNGTRRERERFEKLTKADKRKSIDGPSSRTKREDVVRVASQTTAGADHSNHSRTASGVDDARSSGKNLVTKASNNNNSPTSEDKLGQIEREINVFTASRIETTFDTVDTGIRPGEKPAINAGTDNHVKGKVSAINCETKIDNNAYAAGTSFVNLTSAANPWVSAEQGRKVSEVERKANDNAVKLNRVTNRQSEQIDPESELKNLRQTRGESAHGVTNWKDSIYSDDNLSGNKFKKLGERYTAELDGSDDPDTDARNNLELARSRGDERSSSDVVEWRMIKKSPYHDGRVASRVVLRENGTPVLRVIKDIGFDNDVYLNDPTLWRSRSRRSDFNFAPVLKITDEGSRSPRKIYPRAKRVSQMAAFKDLRVDPEILLEVRKFSRPRIDERYEIYPVLKKVNHESHDVLRSRDDSEFGDRTIYNAGDRLRSPVWPYRYYDDYANSANFRFVSDILGRDDVYRYPAGAYLEYDPFKERTRDLDRRRVARRNKYRLRMSEGAADFSENNSANKSSKFRFARGELRAKTDLPTLANRADYFVSDEAKKYARKRNESNETKSEMRNDRI